MRLKLKELRYVLELSNDKERLASALKEVTETIGEWHNWAELEAIAKDLAQVACCFRAIAFRKVPIMLQKYSPIYSEI